MSKAFVCFQGGKPMNLRCHDSETSRGLASVEELSMWKRGHTILARHAEHDRTGAAIAARFGLQDCGTVTKEMDLAYSQKAPDGSSRWSDNKDFIRYERKRGNPAFVKHKDFERTAKEG